MSDALNHPAGSASATRSDPGGRSGNQAGGSGSVATGPLPPAAGSREDRGTPGRVSTAAETLPSRLRPDVVPAAPSGEGGGGSDPATPHLRYETKFCRACNARGRVHVRGVCVVCRDFGGDR